MIGGGGRGRGGGIVLINRVKSNVKACHLSKQRNQLSNGHEKKTVLTTVGPLCD